MCITENKTKVLRLTFAFFFYFSLFLSISQGYCTFRLFWKYAEIGYFGRLKLFPFQGLTRVHFSLFSENNGLLNIYMLM